MGRRQKAETGLSRTSRSQRKSPSRSDQQFEKRLRIAERLVQDLRKAGYSCGPEDDARPLA